MNTAKRKSFQGLTIVGLNPSLSHAVTEAIGRVFFQLSEPPPLGWSYIFSTIWEALNYPLKCQAAVDIDCSAIWIECVPEEVVTLHIGQLEAAVALANATYSQRMQYQAGLASRQAQSIAEFRERVEEVGRTLYPEDEPVYEYYETERVWGSVFLARMKHAIFKN